MKATLHWVAARTALDAEVRLYDRLFVVEQPGADHDYRQDLNPSSLQVRTAKIEPAAAAVKAGERLQFERLGYFCVDPDTRDGHLVFNRTVTLKDSWARVRDAR